MKIYQKGCSALLAAASRNQEDAVRLLIEHGADVNFSTDDNGASVIAYCLTNPRLLRMTLAAGANMDWRDSYEPSSSMEEQARMLVDNYASLVQHYNPESMHYTQAVRDRDWCQESVEMLERLRLAEWPILSVSQPFKEFPPFRILLWNRVFGSNKAGPRTTEAVARLFGRNKTGLLADLPDGVFWLIVQFLVAGEMRPHVTPIAST